jgi:hypothetical protein
MGRILLSVHEETAANFLTHDVDLVDTLLGVDIVEDSKTTQPEFPSCDRIGTQLLDPARPQRRLMPEMSFHALENQGPREGG